jgi:hypothetical protein
LTCPDPHRFVSVRRPQSRHNPKDLVTFLALSNV